MNSHSEKNPFSKLNFDLSFHRNPLNFLKRPKLFEPKNTIMSDQGLRLGSLIFFEAFLQLSGVLEKKPQQNENR